MPKKSKRSSRRVRQSRVATPVAESRPVAATATASVPARAPAPAKVDLAHEYDYVFKDLRKIAVIAVAMFALLFVLAFVLR